MYWLPLPYVLPEDGVGMPLNIEMLAKNINGIPSREYCLEVAFASLLFFEIGYYLHIILR